MQRAIVTGCSRGIGRAVTEMLLDEGWKVLGVSRSQPTLEHPRFWWQQADVQAVFSLPMSSGDSVALDALIHCAAIRGGYGPLAESDDETWAETITTNLLGAYRIVRVALPALRQSEDGRILLFSGGGAFSPTAGYSAYGVSKAGVVSLMETLAEELRDTSVSVNCVAPGFVATGIHDGTPDANRMEREGAMGDVVACVRHLLSPATRGLTGRTVAAQYDSWQEINHLTVDALNESAMGTRTRHTIQRVQEMFLPRLRRRVS